MPDMLRVPFSFWVTPANPTFDFKVLMDAAITVEADDDPSGILKPGKTFIHGVLSLINFLKAGDKHPPIIFNIFPAILLLVTILKPRMVKGTSLQML